MFAQRAAAAAGLYARAIEALAADLVLIGVQAHDELEQRVAGRTAELAQTVAQLQEEVMVRLEAEKKLRESEERFAAFMQHLPGMATMRDTQGSYIFANFPLVFYTAGFALHRLWGLNQTVAVWLVVGMTGLYTVYGGLMSVAWTNFFQCVLLLGGGFLLWRALGAATPNVPASASAGVAGPTTRPWPVSAASSVNSTRLSPIELAAPAAEAAAPRPRPSAG